jgi:hypothetical protein
MQGARTDIHTTQDGYGKSYPVPVRGQRTYIGYAGETPEDACHGAVRIIVKDFKPVVTD